MAKTTKSVTKDILDVDFEDVTKSKDFDDDGYEEGKSKDRELMAKKEDDTVKGNFGKGGVIYKGKAKDYPGVTSIIKRNRAKVVPINLNKKNKQMAKRKFVHFVPRPKPKKRPRRHKKSLNKDEKRDFKKYARQGR